MFLFFCCHKNTGQNPAVVTVQESDKWNGLGLYFSVRYMVITLSLNS